MQWVACSLNSIACRVQGSRAAHWYHIWSQRPLRRNRVGLLWHLNTRFSDSSEKSKLAILTWHQGISHSKFLSWKWVSSYFFISQSSLKLEPNTFTKRTQTNSKCCGYFWIKYFSYSFCFATHDDIGVHNLLYLIFSYKNWMKLRFWAFIVFSGMVSLTKSHL